MDCRLCNEEYTENAYIIKDDSTVCDRCHMRLYGRFGRCGHGLSGVSDGPCSLSDEVVFDRPDRLKEIRHDLKLMEAAGKLDTPEKRKQAETLLRSAEANAPFQEKVDYQREGHPLDRTDNP